MELSALDDEPISSPPRSSPKDSCASKNIFKGSVTAFQDLIVLKKLGKAKFPVYLARSKVNNQTYAMKAFPLENDRLHPYYQNEIRFCHLRHPNVINSLYYENQRKVKTGKGPISAISYKIMEHAQYGDFFDFIMKNGNIINEKLARTYFKQLIEGLEYLHNRGVSHLDLKLENLLIGENYTLKITDFDLSKFAGDTQLIGKGTKFYRAPEIILRTCKNTNSADIYSAGIILFALKSRGILPHAEHNLINGVDFFELLHKNDPQFWEEHSKIQCRENCFFDKDFKDLFLSMTCTDFEKRATISDIKRSQWYNGPCYSQEELQNIMRLAF